MFILGFPPWTRGTAYRVPRRTRYPAYRVPRRTRSSAYRVRDETQDWSQVSLKNVQNSPNHIKSPKVSMLKIGDVSFDFDFEW